MRNLETNLSDRTKGLTEMLIENMTANAQSLLAVGVFGALLCYLWGSGSQVGGFYGFFLGVGEGCGIVANDTAATKLNGVEKSGVLYSHPFLRPGEKWGAVCCGGGTRGGPVLARPMASRCPAPWCAPPQERSCPSVRPPRGWQCTRAPPRPRCCFLPDI